MLERVEEKTSPNTWSFDGSGVQGHRRSAFYSAGRVAGLSAGADNEASFSPWSGGGR